MQKSLSPYRTKAEFLRVCLDARVISNTNMANKMRMAKSASDWAQHELDAYRIACQPQDAVTFFDVLQLPDPVVIDNEVLDLEFDEHNDATTTEGYDFIYALRLIETNADATNEMTVDCLASTVLRACGYTGIGRSIIPNMSVRLDICGEARFAKANLYVMDNIDYVLLMQENKTRQAYAPDLQAQLIAEAIAAFRKNNKNREKLGLTQRESAIMLGITWKGESPTFYKVPVSVDLADAIQRGIFPAEGTVVRYHEPDIPNPLASGLVDIDNRRHIFSCYEAFSQIVDHEQLAWHNAE